MTVLSSLSFHVMLLHIVLVSAAAAPRWLAESGLELGDAEYSALSTSDRFGVWRTVFGRDYETADHENDATAAWLQNDLIIKTHNDDSSSSYRLGHNDFSDLTLDQFKARNRLGAGNAPRHFRKQPNGNTKIEVTASIPASVDWVTAGAVTDVKNQGTCGSCWSFSTTGAVEGAFFIATGSLVSLSEQQLVSCDLTDGGCSGGLMDNAFKWIKSNGGICTEDDYSYTSAAGSAASCAAGCAASVIVSGYTDVPSNDEDALKAAVAQQPVSVAIEADTSAFQLYESGVLTNSGCGTTLDHGVLTVGYGTDDDGTAYWKVKNSWGPSWGEGGYIRMERGVNMCGISESPSYPTGATSAASSTEDRLTALEGLFNIFSSAAADVVARLA